MTLDLQGTDFDWLPERADWHETLDRVKSLDSNEALDSLCQLANSRMDFARTVKLDRTLQRYLARTDRPEGFVSVRLALLGSSTLTHLLPGLRVAGLRRNLLIEVYEATYGTYRQELTDPEAGIRRFAPTVVLLALDAHHVTALGSPDAALDTIRQCWRTAKQAFACSVLHQTVLPVYPPLLGNQEHRLADSPATVVEAVNFALRTAADEEGVALLALDVFAREAGIRRWYDAGLWHRTKQEVHPSMSPLYGEQAVRVVGAITGQSRKCLVLDLDQTLWSGVIGDDGLDGIVLGHGSPAGEAHLEFQRYVKRLMARGVVLAVSSKNDEVNALVPFQQHAEMLLRREDIACFVANWDDKAANLRRIAKTLNLGLDSLVFVDDNAMERGLIRRELPMVAVPEMPEDPADFVRVLAAAGYFEGLAITGEDRERAALYAANTRREQAAADRPTDLAGFLAGLRMELVWRPFDAAGHARIVQLINKTNQFNLTTRRRGEAEVERIIARPDTLAMQFRLKDIYGDNGMIGIVLCEAASAEKLAAEGFAEVEVGDCDLYIDTWLMSCRVLGRQVEEAMTNVLVEQARRRSARRIFGHYIPTAKNAMVREHYSRLGFSVLSRAANGATLWVLELANYQQRATQIACVEAEKGRG